MDFSEEIRPTRYKGLRDYHLRSALTSSNIDRKKLNKWEKSIIAEVEMFEDNFKICLRDPASILGAILLNSPFQTTYGPDIYHAGWCLMAESRVYNSMETPLLRNAANILMGEKLMTKYWMPSLFLQRAIVISNALNADKMLPPDIFVSNTDDLLGIVTQKLDSIDLTLRIGAECIGVQLQGEMLSVHHIDHLKNWSDKLTERFNIELSCILGHILNVTIYPPVEQMYIFWKIWDKYLVDMGNVFYKCVKVFEALVVGVLLNKNPNKIITPTVEFLDSTIADFDRAVILEHPRLSEALHEMLRFLMDIQSKQYLAQYYGLYRTWGHPVVDPEAGIRKYYTIATQGKVVSEILPVMIRRIFMSKYFCWFKRTKGQYPGIHQSAEPQMSNSVREMILKECSVEELHKLCNSSEWDNIRSCKCIEIPKTYNLSEMVADKAISPDRSGLYELCASGGSLYDANQRRGVLQWLLREPESCSDFLTRVNNEGLSLNESVIGLYQKEREVNETPRMFALMSHSVRNYIVTTESMLSSDILPAFPSITMTNSLLTLQKKIYTVSHQQSLNSGRNGFSIYKDVTIIVNIDFEKWNLNFRRRTTFPIFEAMGDLYGMENLYNRTYDIFEESLIYLADGVFKPEVDTSRRCFVLDPPRCYTGHTGGFEGLRQKGWTLFTDCGLELICARHKCQFSIMGQGDNQVLALTWKTYMLDADGTVNERGKQMLTEQFQSFMRDMVGTFGELGLPIKALETWSSENLFLYGKFPTLNGVPLSMSLKKICRAYYLANEEIMTLDCALATIQSNAMAACLADVTSFVPYVIYKIQVMMALKAYSDYHVLTGAPAFAKEEGDMWKLTTSSGTRYQFPVDSSLSKWKFLIFLSWFPKVLGGLSVASWYDFMARGFPDRAASGFTWVRHLMDSIPDGQLSRALRRVYRTHINPEKNFVLLIEDPCALNLIVPVDARASVRQAVQELFEGLSEVKNEEFAQLFQFNKEWNKDAFCNELCRGDILHPRFLHDIAAATLGGYVDSIVSKISKASTINKIALKSSSRDPGAKIVRHEQNYMRYLIWKSSPNNHYESGIEHKCPTMQVREIRLRSWDKILEGVSVPHPMAFLEFRDCSRDPVHFDICDKNFISVTLPESFCNGDMSSIHELGASPPYLGSETKEKLGADPSRQVFGKEPLIARPLKLLRVINWFVSPGSYSEGMIFKLLESVSDLDPREYVSREMGITGSEAHRYRDQALKHGVMSANMYTLGSHMHISTDTWVKYTRGAENYTINYQAILCMLQALVGGHLFKCHDSGEIPARSYHFHECCNECILPLTEEFHDLASNAALELVPSGRGNPYLWVEETSLTLKYKSDPLLILEIPEMSYEEYRDFGDKRQILTSWIASDILSDILNTTGSEKGPRLLDSRDYPRVMYKKLGVKELWNEISNQLIASSGVKYTGKDSHRATYPKVARGLAIDDLMKCSPSSLMGASMFYSWPDKFKEIFEQDNSSMFPDTQPPTLVSSCTAAQMNLREIIRSCELSSPETLILSRTNRTPWKDIKNFWYRRLCTRGMPCPQCLKEICTYEPSGPLIISKALKCELGHAVVSGSMLRVKILTASEDRVLKDSKSYESRISPMIIATNLPINPAFSEVYSSEFGGKEGLAESLDSETLRYRIKVSCAWQTCMNLPTNSYCRIMETLSIIKHYSEIEIPSTGMILGDGLGTSSKILSRMYPDTDWVVSSLQDSERAIPQSFAHILVPENPSPEPNLNYMVSHMTYNDINSDNFDGCWKSWCRGGICWCEIEFKGSKERLIKNVLSLADWDVLILRIEFDDFKSMADALSEIGRASGMFKSYVSGSLKLTDLELLIIAQNVNTRRETTCAVDEAELAQSYVNAADELYQKSESLRYAEYLSSLEDLNEVTKMIMRVDHWFARVGITHLLECSTLLTPIWWDLQTGKIPSSVKNLGANKAYFMYQSEMVAIQARLISLALSMLYLPAVYKEEMTKFKNWKMKVSSKRGEVVIAIHRDPIEINYGPDNEKVIKFVPILMKINAIHRRGWKYMPDPIVFKEGVRTPGFGISRISRLLPKMLPEIV